MDVYILKEVEAWESDFIISIHRTYEGACNAWYKQRDMEIDLCMKTISEEQERMKASHRSLSQAIDDSNLLKMLENNVEQMKNLTPSDGLVINGREILIAKVELHE